MSKEIFATIGCSSKNPDSVIHRAEELEAHLSSNALYGTPFPTIANLGTALTNAINARILWDNGNGPSASLLDYENKIKVLFGMVVQLCDYVNNTTPDDDVSLSTTGFPLSNDPHHLPLLEAPQNLHRFIARNVGMEKVKLNSKRPANAAPSQKITYKFFRNTTPDFASATVVHEGTKTTFTDVPAITVATVFYYWVTALTPAGESDPSDVCKVTVAPL